MTFSSVITHHPGWERLAHWEGCGVHHEQEEEGKIGVRKEGNEYVLDLFVKVPSGATAPIKYKPVEVDAINQVADGREQRKQVTFDCSKPTF